MIADVVARFCDTQLGSSVAGAHFYLASAGCVLGLRLDSGDDIVIKAYQDRWSEPFLRAAQSAQHSAAHAGIPCARPLRPPAPLPGRRGLAVVETWVPDAGMRPLAGDEERRASAAGLARQIAACTGDDTDGDDSARPGLAEHPMRQDAGRLYPEPHSPLFDFTLETPMGAQVDEMALVARRVRDEGDEPEVVAHLDWSARNVRVEGGQLAAVYDWDSVGLARESTAVGQAAMTWSVTSEPGGEVFPTLDEVVAYVCAYEDAAGHRLGDQQWRAAGAAALYLLAYTARCELAADAARIAGVQHGARDRFVDAGEALLALRRP